MVPSPGVGPLAGLRVLDLTRVLSGPFATLLLADLGAEVWKIEHPDGGDETRTLAPLKDGESHYFMSVNRNKKSVTLDLKDPRGAELASELTTKADVLVENFRPGVAERLGLGYEAVHKANPRLVYCSISAFGQTGPYADRTAFDVAIQALSGLMSLTGEPGGAAVRAGVPMADLVAGIMATVGILGGIVERNRTGEGQHVDTSMFDSMIGMLGYWAGRFFMTGEQPARVGSGHPSVVPYGAFPTSDGEIVIATLFNAYWARLCAAIGRPDLQYDLSLAENEQRVLQRTRVEKELSEVFASNTTKHWEDLLTRADIPHAPILSVGEALHHPQSQARGLVHSIIHPAVGPMQAVGSPFAFSRTPSPLPEPAPLLGQDTADVLGDVLNVSAAELQVLASKGVISLTDSAEPPDTHSLGEPS
jgi:crotonobetainyl-CoA:carnitine CoA-transferase CaiB-like acyl-CoA transferase